MGGQRRSQSERYLGSGSFNEYLTDGRYGLAVECEQSFGTFPVTICHEWNTIAHLNDYEGNPSGPPVQPV
jgi:hypothetical protein